MTWEQLRQWVNDPTRTVAELQQTCVAIGIIVPATPAPTATSLRNRLRNHIVSQPDLTATSPWTPPGWVAPVVTPTPPTPPGSTPGPAAVHQPPWWLNFVYGVAGAFLILLLVAGLIWAWRNIPSASPNQPPASVAPTAIPVQPTAVPAPVNPTAVPTAPATATPVPTPTAAPTTAQSANRPVGYCLVNGQTDQQAIQWEPSQKRLWMSDNLVQKLKQLGGNCWVQFAAPTGFTLNSVEGDISLDGKSIRKGNGLLVTGSRLEITYHGTIADGFDAWVK